MKKLLSLVIAILVCVASVSALVACNFESDGPSAIDNASLSFITPHTKWMDVPLLNLKRSIQLPKSLMK